jgi:drug/metabolite transporter (DMT)-like permease
MDVLLALLAAYLVIRLIAKKRLRDLPIRWSFVLLALALAPACYFVFGLLERAGVIQEIYADHAYSAMLGGSLAMILISPAMLFFAILTFLKERKARK